MMAPQDPAFGLNAPGGEVTYGLNAGGGGVVPPVVDPDQVFADGVAVTPVVAEQGD